VRGDGYLRPALADIGLVDASGNKSDAVGSLGDDMAPGIYDE
jgi:hypothetical protein